MFACPVLAIYGGADRGIPPEARETFDRALDSAGVEHRSITFDDAPHSFFDRKAADYADASSETWREVLAFMEG
jgi:carboxymethylenebutenolidase